MMSVTTAAGCPRHVSTSAVPKAITVISAPSAMLVESQGSSGQCEISWNPQRFARPLGIK